MFWVMMYMILFNGSVTPELGFVPEKSAILESVSDERRLPVILSIREKMASQEEALISSMKKRYRRLAAISRDHGASDESFDAVFESLDRERTAIQKALIQNRFKMRKQMTREEWNEVFEK